MASRLGAIFYYAKVSNLTFTIKVLKELDIDTWK